MCNSVDVIVIECDRQLGELDGLLYWTRGDEEELGGRSSWSQSESQI